MITDAEVQFPLLRLADAYVIYDREYFTKDDGKADLRELIDDSVTIDATGRALRIVEVTRIVIPKKGLFGFRKFRRQYEFAEADPMTFAEVKAAVVDVMQADPFPWVHDGPPLEHFLERVERARTMEELCDVADDNCVI